jgi:uroporphyrin-3 C-methyltransferase
MVRIRQRDVAMEAPLTPDQFYYLQQNMHLMLEQAQVALLREEPSLYQHSLQRVEQWLDQYLMAEDERTRAVRTTLSELQQWQVAPAAPDISASLRQLQKLVEQQRRGTVAPLQSEAQEPAA